MIYLKLFLTFLKIGAFTFGGGYAMLPLIQEEIIKNSWMTQEQLINFIAISESTPGPFAINISTFIGYEKSGFLGALCATIGVIFTSFILLILIAKFFSKYKKNKWIVAIMKGLKPAVVGLILAAVFTTGKAVFFPNNEILENILTIEFLKTISIFIITMIMALKKIHPIIIVIVSTTLGIIIQMI